MSVAPGGERRAGQRSGSEPTPPQRVRGRQNSSAPGGEQRGEHPQNIATAITDVSERVAVLVREEVELAKAEVAEKLSKLAKGAVVAAAAGIFVVTALFLVLIGCAWLLYYVLPVPTFAYFWGFFAMAAILLVLGALAGLVAAKVVKKSAPPVPTMAIEEARLIREAMGAGSEQSGSPSVGAEDAGAPDGAAGSHPAPGGSEAV